MNLVEFRKHLRTQTGRHELISEEGSNLGIDPFINAGSRYLDRLTLDDKRVGKKYISANADEYLLSFSDNRSVLKVFAATSAGKVELELITFSEMWEKFPESMSGSTAGVPKYFTTAFVRPLPEDMTQTDIDNYGDLAKYIDVIPDGGHVSVNGIIIGPKCSETTLFEIVGLFYNATLIADTDTNFWLYNHQEILTLATMMQMEMPQRNTQGVNDMARSIEMLMLGINLDSSELDSMHADQMGG